MWCEQYPACAFLQYLRQPTINCLSPHAPPGGLFSASRPAILSLPVSRKLLGGRASKQDKQHSNRATPSRHRRLDRLDSLRRVRRRNSRLYRRNPRLGRTRTVRVRPRPQYDTSPDILRSRHRIPLIHRFPRRHTSRPLWDSILPGTRKNRSSRNTTTNDTATARKTTLVARFSQKRAM